MCILCSCIKYVLLTFLFNNLCPRQFYRTTVFCRSTHDQLLFTISVSVDGFVNFQSIALYDEMYGYIMSAVVFMATIQFLKLLQFNQKMGMLGDTVKLAAKDLKVLWV